TSLSRDWGSDVCSSDLTMSGPDAVPLWRGRDLDDRVEIAEMVRRFYADVAQDDLLGPMFNDVAQVDWSAHLPKLTAFWCRALLSARKRGVEGTSRGVRA